MPQLRSVLVALLSALGATWLYGREGLTLKLLLLGALLTGLLLITIIDIEHREIFIVTITPAAVLALLYGGLAAERGGDMNPWVATLLGGLAQGLIIYGIYWSGILFSKLVTWLRSRPVAEEAFGFGDVYLAGVLGLAVGWPGVLLALVLTILIGGAMAGLVMLVTRLQRRYDVYMPYGPALVLGAVLILLWNQQIAAWYLGR